MAQASAGRKFNGDLRGGGRVLRAPLNFGNCARGIIAQQPYTVAKPLFQWPITINNLGTGFLIQQFTVNDDPSGASGYSYYSSQILGGYSSYGGALTVATLNTQPGAVSFSVNASLLQVSVNVAMDFPGNNSARLLFTPTRTGSTPQASARIQAQVWLFGVDDQEAISIL